MKYSIIDFLNKLKQLVVRLIHLMENKWFKIFAISFLLIYSVYFLIKQYLPLKIALLNLTPNFSQLIISSIILLISVLLSVNSWRQSIAAFGSSFPWVQIAHTQMLSMLGKYIPGHIWNYSSKIYLSYKMGFSAKLSGFAVIIEMIITYLMALILFLIVTPMEIFNVSNNWFLVIRTLGLLTLVLLVLSPLLFSKFLKEKLLIKSPHRLIAVILNRAVLWVLPSYSFSLLIVSFGYPNVGLQNAISAITLSFFVGYFAIFVPDGLFVREASIIFLLSSVLSTADATLVSLLFRFQLVLVEFMAVILVLISWKIFNKQKILEN